ncbi:thermonuclease family protein [Uliginosibacterium sp. TH139]|uniref:thermonuclease family protein n=1 Tax=Uliginosibacterium sp. TH139 TaxID=2067453 RepID=UPI000C7CF10A|nr:thermonuclease family protein [Uliginosibacterium sp. TH139]PLK48297.1 nuclease [Uliginosibacterium sp. TH139]
MTNRFPHSRLLALCVCLASNLVWSAEYTGNVVGVSDGDTVTILDSTNKQHKVRLSGIDAPEKRQSFGTASKENLSNLVFAKVVTVETSKTDRYGREVGKLLVAGQDANLEQVRSGLAWHYKAYEREQPPAERRLYADTEIEAKRLRRGLWDDEMPMPPWEFRKTSRATP